MKKTIYFYTRIIHTR